MSEQVDEALHIALDIEFLFSKAVECVEANPEYTENEVVDWIYQQVPDLNLAFRGSASIIYNTAKRVVALQTEMNLPAGTLQFFDLLPEFEE